LRIDWIVDKSYLLCARFSPLSFCFYPLKMNPLVESFFKTPLPGSFFSLLLFATWVPVGLQIQPPFFFFVFFFWFLLGAARQADVCPPPLLDLSLLHRISLKFFFFRPKAQDTLYLFCFFSTGSLSAVVPFYDLVCRLGYPLCRVTLSARFLVSRRRLVLLIVLSFFCQLPRSHGAWLIPSVALLNAFLQSPQALPATRTGPFAFFFPTFVSMALVTAPAPSLFFRKVFFFRQIVLAVGKCAFLFASTPCIICFFRRRFVFPSAPCSAPDISPPASAFGVSPHERGVPSFAFRAFPFTALCPRAAQLPSFFCTFTHSHQ